MFAWIVFIKLIYHVLEDNFKLPNGTEIPILTGDLIGKKFAVVIQSRKDQQHNVFPSLEFEITINESILSLHDKRYIMDIIGWFKVDNEQYLATKLLLYFDGTVGLEFRNNSQTYRLVDNMYFFEIPADNLESKDN